MIALGDEPERDEGASRWVASRARIGATDLLLVGGRWSGRVPCALSPRGSPREARGVDGDPAPSQPQGEAACQRRQRPGWRCWRRALTWWHRTLAPARGCHGLCGGVNRFAAAQGPLAGIDLRPMSQQKQRGGQAGDEGRPAAEPCAAPGGLRSTQTRATCLLHTPLSSICDRAAESTPSNVSFFAANIASRASASPPARRFLMRSHPPEMPKRIFELAERSPSN